MPLANFIHKAKTIYGIKEVGAVGETFQSFIAIDAYNQLFINDPSFRFDVYHMEFEFWNEETVQDYYCTAYLQESGYNCNTLGAFDYYYKELQNITALAHATEVKVESYIGFPSSDQSQKIGELVDRLLVHFYRQSDVYVNGNSIYNYHHYRLKDLSPTTGSLEILPIFSARPLSMGPWLENNPIEQAYDTFMYGKRGYLEQNGSWKDHINIEGYQWYRYTDLLEFAQGEANNNIVTVYPNPTQEMIHFEFTNPGNTKVSLTDVFGKINIDKIIPINNEGHLDVSSLKNGIYFLIFYFKDKQEAREIFINN
jgi:hypothetical protein